LTVVSLSSYLNVGCDEAVVRAVLLLGEPFGSTLRVILDVGTIDIINGLEGVGALVG